MFAFDNQYAQLPERFYALQDPVPVRAPVLLCHNAALAEQLQAAAVPPSPVLPARSRPPVRALRGRRRRRTSSPSSTSSTSSMGRWAS